MKRKNITSIFTLALILSFTAISFAQKFKDLDVSPMDRAAFPLSHNDSDKTIRVTYSRPQLKGRTVESLTPYGEVWRTGANEATEITFYKDAYFGESLVRAGTYSLFTIPDEEHWIIILSKDLNVWGAYEYNESNDVVRIKAHVSKGDEYLEAFSIAFDEKSNMYLAWGNVVVTIPITYK